MKKFLIAALPFAAIFMATFFMMQPAAQAEHDGHAGHDHAATENAAAEKPATEKPVMAYTCDPADFTLTQDGDKYTLAATLDTPTPNFSYRIEDTADKNGRIKATLKLDAPEGMQLTVIDKIDISHTFEHAGMLHMLSLNVEKNFNWGPDSVNCTHN